MEYIINSFSRNPWVAAPIAILIAAIIGVIGQIINVYYKNYLEKKHVEGNKKSVQSNQQELPPSIDFTNVANILELISAIDSGKEISINVTFVIKLKNNDD